MFVAALLVITKTWKSSSVHSVNEWINKHPDKRTLFHTKETELASVKQSLYVIPCKYWYLYTLIHDHQVLSESRENENISKPKSEPEQGHSHWRTKLAWTDGFRPWSVWLRREGEIINITGKHEDECVVLFMSTAISLQKQTNMTSWEMIRRREEWGRDGGQTESNVES